MAMATGAVALAVAVEKLAPGGERIVRPIGAGLVLAGSWLLLSAGAG